MKKLKLFATVLSLAVVLSGCATTNETAKKSSDPRPSVILPFTGTDYTPLPAGTDGTAGKNASYVLFGDWPQTIKADSVTVDETKSVMMGDFTYYKGSDGAWYAKCIEKAFESGYKYSDGTDVAQESANSTKYFKVEPIKWRVLTNDYNGKKLLLAENILAAHRYAASSNNYKDSEIREWLNGTFLGAAFTSTAQNQIATTNVDNSADSTTDNENNLDKATSYACENTSDKIFLLSEQEVTNSDYGFTAYAAYGTGNSRIRMTTDWSKAGGAYQSAGYYGYYGGWWWLRSPSYLSSSSARGVYIFATADYSISVDSRGAGVVPALSIMN